MTVEQCKTWLKDNLGDATRAPSIVVNGRTFNPVQGFNRGGVIVIIYKDTTNSQYHVQIANTSIGFFDASMQWDELLTKISEAYCIT